MLKSFQIDAFWMGKDYDLAKGSYLPAITFSTAAITTARGPQQPHRGEPAPPPDCRCETNTDRFTRTITRGVAQVLFDVFGEAPYVVIANFDRAFIDANRRDECAFEDRHAKPFYEEYHNTVRNFVDEIRTGNGGLGLLFDIHGTTQVANDPADVYLGTLNGQAISSLSSRDTLAMWRRRSLPGLLREAGYVVSAKIPETLRGDFTLETYGSSNADGVDAIQMEIESTLRTDASKRGIFIEDLAYAMSSLVARCADTLTLAAFRSANFLPRL